jgi:hypothetical protein
VDIEVSAAEAGKVADRLSLQPSRDHICGIFTAMPQPGAAE